MMEEFTEDDCKSLFLSSDSLFLRSSGLADFDLHTNSNTHTHIHNDNENDDDLCEWPSLSLSHDFASTPSPAFHDDTFAVDLSEESPCLSPSSSSSSPYSNEVSFSSSSSFNPFASSPSSPSPSSPLSQQQQQQPRFSLFSVHKDVLPSSTIPFPVAIKHEKYDEKPLSSPTPSSSLSSLPPPPPSSSLFDEKAHTPHTLKTEKDIALSRKMKRTQRAAIVRANRLANGEGGERREGERGGIGKEEEEEEEDKRMKKQRRMMRNRESALQSRLRKKVYTEELEGKVRELQRVNEELVVQNRRLILENEQLRRAFVSSSSSSSSSVTPSPFYGSPLRASGLITFVVLFSFGFIYHFNVLGPSTATSLSSSLTPLAYTGRNLHSLENTHSVTTTSLSKSSRSSSSSPSSRWNLLSFIPSRKSSDPPPKDSVTPRPVPTIPVSSNNRTSHRHRLSKPSSPSSSYSNNHTEAVVVSSSNYLESQPRTIEWKEDTAYFFCGQGERVLPMDHTDGPKDKLSILIPSQILNMTDVLRLSPDDDGEVFERGDYLIEISCHIQSMSFYEVIEPEHVDADPVIPI